MAFGTNPGLVSDGLGADAYRQIVPGRYTVAAGAQIPKGQIFKRNVTIAPGRNDLAPVFSQADVWATPTSGACGLMAGAYPGNPITNTNSVGVTYNVPLVRQGVTSVRCGTLNGGTAVTIGSILGSTAALGASTYDVPTVPGGYVIGGTIGIVVGYPIQTSSLTAVSAAGTNTISVLNTDGISTSTALTVDYGLPTLEIFTPSAVTAQVKSYGSITLGGTAAANTVLTATVAGVSASYTTVAGDTTTTIAATNFAKAINQSLIVQGINALVAPAVSVGAVVYFTALNAGTASNAITLTASAVGGTVTATASGATLANGTYGTVTGTFQNPHGAGSIVNGTNTTNGATLIPAPAATGGFNIDTVLCDIALIGV